MRSGGVCEANGLDNSTVRQRLRCLEAVSWSKIGCYFTEGGRDMKSEEPELANLFLATEQLTSAE